MESPTLRIRLLGALDLRYGDTPLPPLESARAESLLAYLLLHRDAPQSRQHLAFLLWPDSTESQARTNLRHLLHILRRSLPAPDRFLQVTLRTIQWRPETPVWLDIAAFMDAISRADHEIDGGLAALREAVDLYTGNLLDGCYDEWLLDERERFRARYLDALIRLTTLLEAQNDLSAAIHVADLLVRHDPLREETYRRLMRLHDGRGDRARALHVYHRCAATLERELGVTPSAATLEAYDALLSGPAEATDGEAQRGRLGGPPFIGRTAERKRLTDLWRASEAGRSQFLLVTGEPGIGKTRLIEELQSWCEHRGVTTATARSYAAEGALTYGPVVDWLRSEALRPRLMRLDRPRLGEVARLLPELLAEAPGAAHAAPLPEHEQRQRLFDALARAILMAGGPLLLIGDDIQWCDPETLQFLHYLLRVAPDAPLLVAATARREEIDLRHPLNDLFAGLQTLGRFTEIPLERLTRQESVLLAERLTGCSFADPDAERLFGETEGNPLFVIEALRAGWAGDETGPSREWMTPRVQTVIESRLTRLSESTRDLVGVAATIGRAFTTDVLAAASGTDADVIVRGLDELWRRRIVREQGADAYDFSHDKIREVAYRALSPAQRRQNHRRVAAAIARLHAHEPGPVSGQLAAHLEQAGAIDEAVEWYARAADTAQYMSANGEAIRLLDHALDLLGTLPPTPERQARELAILVALPAPLGWADGWASERLAAVHRRALDLARSLGVEPAPHLLRSLAIATLARRDFVAARGYGERLYAQGVCAADDMLLVEAAYVLGIAAFWQGEFEVAREHFETAVDRYHPDHRREHLLRYGLDPQVICLSRLGNTLWFLGRPEAAVKARDAALALADEIGHPYSRATALVFAAVLSHDMGDLERVRAYAAMLTVGLEDHGTRPTRVSTEAIAGFVDVRDGREQVGLARIQRALDDVLEADHAPGMRAHVMRVLLEAHAVTGDARAALAAADRALASDDAARLWEAEIRRRRAEFLAALGAPAEEIEAEFGRASAVARRQGAKMLDLRIALGLFRFRQERGDEPGMGHAREHLAAIVENLPEKGEFPDLRAALAILSRG